MPGIDGIEVLRRMRAGFPDLPVVILTDWASDEQTNEARQLGVTGPLPGLDSLTFVLMF